MAESEGRRGISLRVTLLLAFGAVSVLALAAFLVVEGLGVEAGLDATSAAEEGASQRAHTFLYRWGLFSALVALAVAILTASWFVLRLARPLERLRATAASFTAGDTSARARLHTGIREVDALSETFDEMADATVAAEASRSRLVRDISHELRNPLTVVQGRLEEMRDGLAPADPESLDVLHRECLRLSRVADDLSVVGSAASPSARVKRQHTDLADVARATAGARAGEASRLDIDMELDLHEATLLADPDRLSQVLGNILDNSLRYCPAGSSVVVRTGRRGSVVEVVVDDSGPGMSEQDRARACEREYRGASGTGTTGSGLGLAVAADWVHAHGGEIDLVTSELGGTRVSVRLPALSSPDTTGLAGPAGPVA